MLFDRPLRFRFLAAVSVAALALVILDTPAASEVDRVKRRARSEMPGDPPAPYGPPSVGPLPAPPVTFQSYTSIQVNVASGGANIFWDAANEPSIAVDPNRPNRMAIGWRQFDSLYSNFREAGWAYTIDGGRTWTFPGVLEQSVFRSDPVLSFDAAGHFYYASLKVVGSMYTVDVFKSWNGGATWPQKVSAFGGDKEWFTVDRTGGAGSGHVYEAWSVAAGCCADNTFTRSVDGGMVYSTPQPIPLQPVWGTLAVGPDGSLYIAGTDIDDQSIFYVAKSTNAKNPSATPTFDFVVPVDLGGQLQAFAGAGSPNPDGLLGQVWIAVDHSNGPTRGYVYVLASVDPPTSDPLDVRFIRSTDGGLTWSTPVRVNKDPGTLAWQWFATMSVAPNGRIDVVWNDTRNTGSYQWSQLFYSSSTDGGVTWSADQVLSPPWNSYVGWPQQFKIGDYYDMVSDLVGANVAWAATFNDEQDVYYLRVGEYDCNTNGVADSQDILNGKSEDLNANGIPDECEDLPTDIADSNPLEFELHPNVPNPFNPATTIRYDMPAVHRARIRVFDVTGRVVRTLVDRVESPGEKSIEWDGRDEAGRPVASGIYFCRLEADRFTSTRKMVLLR